MTNLWKSALGVGLIWMVTCDQIMAQSPFIQKRATTTPSDQLRSVLKYLGATDEHILEMQKKYSDRLNRLEAGVDAVFAAFLNARKESKPEQLDAFRKHLDDELARIHKELKQHREQLEDHEKRLKDLEDDRNKDGGEQVSNDSREGSPPVSNAQLEKVDRIVWFRSELCIHAFPIAGKGNVTTALARGGFMSGALYDSHGSRVLVVIQ